MSLLVPLVVIMGLVLLNGLFVAAEFAIIGVRQSRVEQLAAEGNATAIKLREILTKPGQQDRYIATAQLGITLASLGLGMYGEPAIAHVLEGPLHDWLGLQGAIVHTISFVIALSLMTYLHVVVGEMVPKSLALQDAERVAIALNAPMTLFRRLFGVAIVALNQLGLLILRLMRVPPPGAGSRLHTPDELELIVSESAAAGILAGPELQLVSNIFDLSERRVADIMTPRPRVAAIPLSTSESALVASALEASHTRLPVYNGTLDQIAGVLHLKDFVQRRLQGQPFDLATLLKPPLVVPESLYAEGLLDLFRTSRRHLAVVIDEYGGTAGVVTLEDLLEEIVGEVQDEFDIDEEAPLVELAPGHWRVAGGLPIADLPDPLASSMIAPGITTVAGWVLLQLNRPPQEGDEVQVEEMIVRVEQVTGLRIDWLTVRSPQR
jgi:CBS domain containing-hemolysin-like protein